MNDTALVTLAIGQRHLLNWKKYCEAGWRAYAHKHQMDVIVVSEPLDQSEQAQVRSPSWQKCLVLSQPWAAQYRQIVLLDSDVAINAVIAPRITNGVPLERVGGVISGSHIQDDLRIVLLSRLRGRDYPYEKGLSQWRQDQDAFYGPYELPPPAEGIIQGGVLVTSPAHHRDLFRHLYLAPDPQPFNTTYEQIPLSYEILSRNLFYALDTRFNSVFIETMLVYYPYLEIKELPDFDVLATYATRAQFLNNFFLHFAYDAAFMRYLPVAIPSTSTAD